MVFDKNFDLKKLDKIRKEEEKLLGDKGVLSINKNCIINSVDENIYHYTSMDSLRKIIENKCFFATRSDFLNDKKEEKHINYILDKCIDKIDSKESFKSFCVEFKKIYIDKSWYRKDYLYIVSFSKSQDNMALWENYTQGVGCNIKLRLRNIMDIIDYDKTKELPILFNVIYNDDEKIKIVEEVLNNGYYTYNYMIDKLKCYQLNDIYTTVMYDMFIVMKNLAVLFKQKEFFQENEARLVLHNINVPSWMKNKVNPRNIGLKSEKIERNDVFFREKEGALIPYIKVYMKRDFFDGICIGPKNNSDIAERGWKEYFMYNKYNNITIDKSNIPLRY